ncbi:hypothetical protein MUP95_01605 [bacterium]|nr:hypothetical protein [bacterium]
MKSLNDHNVKYVIIGATAFPVHGYVRATLDIDIFIQPEQENGERALRALSHFGYDTSEITVEDLLKKKVLIRQYAIETDIHPFVSGVHFDEVWEDHVEGSYGTARTYFAGLHSLIKMKKAAGRPKDLEDLKYLERLAAKEKE